MTAPVTTRLFFADGSSELVALSERQAYRERYLRPVVTGESDGLVHWRAVEFKRREFWVPPDFVGPLISDDVHIEHDIPGRAAMERTIGADKVRREIGPSREGWRIVGIFVEVAL